jgi:DNA-binding NarL/FixJ family response regulator
MMGTDETITPQEQRILQLLADGKPTKEVAKAMHLTVSTVTFYMYRIREKMEVPTNTNAVATAIRRGIID